MLYSADKPDDIVACLSKLVRAADVQQAMALAMNALAR